MGDDTLDGVLRPQSKKLSNNVSPPYYFIRPVDYIGCVVYTRIDEPRDWGCSANIFSGLLKTITLEDILDILTAYSIDTQLHEEGENFIITRVDTLSAEVIKELLDAGMRKLSTNENGQFIITA